MEFFAFSAEAPDEPWTLARTEQGVLATLFRAPLNAWYDDAEESGARGLRRLEAAARSVGFRHFEPAEAVFREKYPKGYDAVLRAYRKLVRDIDAGLLENGGV